MNKSLLTLVVVLSLFGGYLYYHHYQTDTVAPHPVVVPQETPTPEVKHPEPSIRPNQETAPKNEPMPVTVPDIKKDSGPIRYDKVPERPWGYFDYCDRYPTRPECGGKK